jgi:hypothetical protein
VEEKPVSIENEIQVPEEVTSRMQERAATLRRQAIDARIRYEIEQRVESSNGLSPRERTRLANRLGRTVYSADGRATESAPDFDRITQFEQARAEAFDDIEVERVTSFQGSDVDTPDRSGNHSTREDFDDDNTSDSDFSASDVSDRPRTSPGEHAFNRSDVQSESDEQQ